MNLLTQALPWQFYEVEYEPERRLGLEWYKKRKEFDNYNIIQKFKKAYIDIEVFTEFKHEFPEPKYAKYPIVLISLAFDDEDTAYAFVLFHKKFHKNINVEELEKELTELINKHYSKINEVTGFKEHKVKVFAYFGLTKKNEKQMLIDFWNLIHEKRPFTIAGYYSTFFDFPYIYNRMINLKLKPEEIMTQFGQVIFNENDDKTPLQVPEYMFVDMRYIYKPGDGLGFGEQLDNFELDNVAFNELGIKKVELNTPEGKDFDLAYKDYIEDYIFYNLVDTLLLKALDYKGNFIFQYNNLRRMSKSLFKSAYRGATKYGEDLMRFIYDEKGIAARSFMPVEKIPFKSKKLEDAYSETTYALRIFGAYVKEPEPNYITGLNIDFDQTSMYPSVVQMFNIDFTTLRARLFNYTVSKIHQKIKKMFYLYKSGAIDQYKKEKEQIKKIHRILIDGFIKEYKPQQKTKIKKLNPLFMDYFLEEICYFIEHQKELGINEFEEIFNKKENWKLLKTRVIPYYENLNHISFYLDGDLNVIVYFYVIAKGDVEKWRYYLFEYYTKFYGDKNLKSPDDLKDFKFLVHREPVSPPKWGLEELTLEELKEKYFEKYIATFYGAFFDKHKTRPGIMLEFVVDYKSLRKKLKGIAKEWFHEGDIEKYDYYYSLQGKVVKPQLNAMSYGVNIVPSFYLSEKSIGGSITTNSKVMIKFAQSGTQKFYNGNFNKMIKEKNKNVRRNLN